MPPKSKYECPNCNEPIYDYAVIGKEKDHVIFQCPKCHENIIMPIEEDK